MSATLVLVMEIEEDGFEEGDVEKLADRVEGLARSFFEEHMVDARIIALGKASG